MAGTQLAAQKIDGPKIEAILADVAAGVPVEQAVGATGVAPLDFDRFLVSRRGGPTRRALAIAVAKANRSDFDRMQADSEAFGWQASLARVKMRGEMEARRAVGETNLLCNELLWG